MAGDIPWRYRLALLPRENRRKRDTYGVRVYCKPPSGLIMTIA